MIGGLTKSESRSLGIQFGFNLEGEYANRSGNAARFGSESVAPFNEDGHEPIRRADWGRFAVLISTL